VIEQLKIKFSRDKHAVKFRRVAKFEHTCTVCKLPYLAKKTGALYCGETCRGRLRYGCEAREPRAYGSGKRARRFYEHECSLCGRGFTTQRRTSLTCGRMCGISLRALSLEQAAELLGGSL
jgi:hypothetical protein